MQHWVKRPWAEAVPMPSEFANQIQAENRLLRSVIKDMEADEPKKEGTCDYIGFRYRHAVIVTSKAKIVNNEINYTKLNLNSRNA